MSCSKDSGASVVIAFLIILTIVALAVGMWAVVGIPGQIREANEVHAVYVTDSMTDYKVMLQNLHKDDFKNLNVSTILPVGSSHTSGTMILNGTKVGTLSVGINGNAPVWSQDVNRFTLKVSSDTIIGYEGGGVFRSDNGNYVWSVYPEFTVLNKSNILYVNMGNISNITGDIAVGLSGDIAVNTRYISNSTPESLPLTIKGGKEIVSGVETVYEPNFVIKYESTSSDDANLWYSLFYETYYKYLSSGEFNSENLSVSISKSGKTVTMNIISKDIEAKAYLSGYTYNAGLVPDYVVKEADIVVNGVVYKYKNKVSIDDITELITANSGILSKGSVYKTGDDHYVAITDIYVVSISSPSIDTILNNYFVKINTKGNVYSGYLYTNSDIDNNDWKEPAPSKGSLFLDGNNLYIYTIDPSSSITPSTSVASSEDWVLISEGS